jgi:inner membrane transporter RhtA
MSRVPSVALVMGAVLSVQTGSALATHIFQAAGPAGATLLRVGFGAVILLALWRPRLRLYGRHAYRDAILFGLTTAAMNLSFYSALDRIPLGIAVTLEFLGPLTLAVIGSRRLLDLLWIGLAAAGVLLLTPVGGLQMDPVGLAFALLAGCFWALYIVFSARVGRAFTGGNGLAIALLAGSLALLPFGIISAGSSLFDGRVLLIGLAVGLLSAVIPYSLEMEALRSIPTGLFGVLMSTEPAVGALIGFLLLRQVLGPRAVVAILLVMAASIGATRESTTNAVPPPA